MPLPNGLRSRNPVQPSVTTSKPQPNLPVGPGVASRNPAEQAAAIHTTQRPNAPNKGRLGSIGETTGGFVNASGNNGAAVILPSDHLVLGGLGDPNPGTLATKLQPSANTTIVQVSDGTANGIAQSVVVNTASAVTPGVVQIDGSSILIRGGVIGAPGAELYLFSHCT